VVLSSIAVDPGHADAAASLRCQVEPGHDPSARLGDELQQSGVAVHELRVELPTLEEYFYAITDGRDQQEELQAAEQGSEPGAEPGAEPGRAEEAP